MTDDPKPTTGYVVVPLDWDPARHPTHAWNPHPTLKQAQEDLAHADIVGAKMTILKVHTTYTPVGGGGRG